MINFDEVTGENTQEHNPQWPKLANHPYRMVIVGDSGSYETNALLNHEPEIDNIFLYASDSF